MRNELLSNTDSKETKKQKENKKQKDISYKVKNGDTLIKIANKYENVTVEDLRKWNNLKKNDVLKKGDVLKIKA
jgi:membrane-bound lytic murein transglycosylase D